MDAVKLAIAGAALLLVAAGAVVSGVLPPDDLVGIAERVAPILAFVVAVTIVAPVSFSTTCTLLPLRVAPFAG